MRNFVFCLLLGLAAPLSATEVVTRPEYSQRWNVTIVTDGRNTIEAANLEHLLATDVALQNLLANTNLTRWDANTPWIASTDWAYLLSATSPPLIFMQPPSDQAGRSPVVFLAHGRNIPTDGSLDEMLITIADQHSLVAQCPTIRPKPAPSPAPQPLQPLQPLQPTIQPTPPPNDRGIPLLLLFLPLAGAGLGIWHEFKPE